MDIATVVQLVETALRNPPFRISGVELQSPPVSRLLTGHLGSDRLQLADTPPAEQTGESITVSGTLAVPLHGLPDLTATAVFTVVGGLAQVRVELSGLPADWRPSASFPSLAGSITDSFTYSRPRLVLDSQNPDALPVDHPAVFGFPAFTSTTSAKLVRGLSLHAEVALQSPPAGLGALAGGTTWDVSGEIALLPSAVTTCLATRPSTHPFSIAGYDVPFRVAVVAAALQPADGTLPVHVASVLQFDAEIDKDVGGPGSPHVIRLPLRLRTLPCSAGTLTLGSNLPAKAPIALTELASLVSGHDVAGQIPTTGGFPVLDDIVLEDVSVTFAPSLSQQLVSVSATVGLVDPDPAGWKVFDELVAFHGMAVTFTYLPALAEMITTVEARAAVAGGTLDAEISLPDLTFDLELAEDTSLDIKQIIQHIAGASIGMPQVTCSRLAVHGDVPGRVYTVQASVTDSWSFTLGGKTFALTEIDLGLTYDKALSGEITGLFTLAGQQLWATATYVAATSSWSFAGGTRAPITLDVPALASGLARDLGLDFPASNAPAGLMVENLNIFYDTAGSLEFTGLASFEVADAACSLGVSVRHSADRTHFTGMLFVGDEAFEVDFSSSAQTSVLTGTWSAVEGAAGLGITAVIAGLGFTPPALPPELDLRLINASFTYDITTKAFVITAESTSHGKAIFAAVPVGQDTEYFFGLSVGHVGLGGLPVVGEALAKVLAIGDVHVVLSSQPLTKPIADALRPLIPQGYPAPPSAGTADRIALCVTIDLAGTQLPLSIGMGAPKSTGSNTVAPPPPAGSPVTATPPAATDGTTWFTVQRTVGPLTLQRVGARYLAGALTLLLDATLTVGGLSITLLGLSVTSPVSDFCPVLGLDGLGIGYTQAPLAIGGAFEKIVPPPKGTTWEYGGGVTVSLPDLQLAAIGAFADLDRVPSMFVFARLNAPLGGPPFFFVTGLAGGFGYNSALRIPTQDQVVSFPLVAGSTGAAGLQGATDPLTALSVLTGGTEPWITPAAGAIWVAAGVTFTSFELVCSQALLIAELGSTDLTVALLGLSTARFPRTGPVTYAQIQLELQVVVRVYEGSFAATALLTPQSYLLDPACRLTGGFAFCFWFGQNPHQGDFVLTVGGYSPYYTAPAWYPLESRVGFTWNVSSKATVSGNAYFALTPAAVMAGGALSVNFHDGNLTAWLTAHADVIAWWQPFHFRAGIGVSIGASYRLDLGVCSKTLTVELGAEVDLWGPPTGGTATVHIWILSFTVAFGAGPSDDPRPLEWPDFKGLLPSAPITLTATAGMTGQERAPNGTTTWIVRSGSFAFSSRCAVPATSLSFGGAAAIAERTGVDILPMQLTGASSPHVLSITRNGKAFPAPCTATAATAAGPKALWGTGSGKALVPADQQLVPGLLVGMDIAVTPPAIAPTPGVISLADSLGYDPLPQTTNVPVLAHSPAAGPVPTAGRQTVRAIVAGIASETVATARGELFGVLATLGYRLAANAPMTQFAGQAGSLFTDEPLLVAAP
ncbi:DUF6603 domain-containing protein [Catenulispora subtropica]|uniref:DUF6603 domain-containing protein n=1 Tax=Catenulispora subtropica TaxID=450798 RepID=A0ABN2QRD3_9ACTN